jgi:putative SOS response-associated peptidase YedK
MINARAETLSERSAYRGAFERFRCLIPADGFYEWQAVPGESRKQPFHITRTDHELFAFAGLWSVWHRGEPEELRSCTIITTAANTAVARVHDRMPVILPRDAESVWLAHDAPLAALEELLGGLPSAEMGLRPVGPAVNDARYDGPECLFDPPPPAQETLFAP